jgi:phage gp37-like protein
MDFDFIVGGIEDAILQVLENEMKPLGVREFASYSGELDSENLRQAIAALAPRFPLVMVAYAQGVDKQMPVTSPVFGEPIIFRHDCSFVVVCASADARGDKAQRRGAPVKNQTLGCYKMIAKVRELLTGLQIKAVSEEAEVFLTHQPLMPTANEFIARLPQITAYAVPFDTYFKWSSKNRKEAGTQVEELLVGVESLNASSGAIQQLPGVKFKT